MRIQTRRPGSGGDAGFTLVELIIAIAIIGIITVPLGEVIIGYLRNTDATTARLLASHDVQITSAYWAQDVASIGTRWTTDHYPLKQSVWTDASSPYSCSTAGTPIVSLAWDDFSSADTPTLVQVVYMEQTVLGPTGLPQKELHRVRCEQSSSGWSPWVPTSPSRITSRRRRPRSRARRRRRSAPRSTHGSHDR